MLSSLCYISINVFANGTSIYKLVGLWKNHELLIFGGRSLK